MVEVADVEAEAASICAAKLDAFADRLFRWRVAESQPVVRDDVPRCQRPSAWQPDFSAAALERMRSSHGLFQRELGELVADEDMGSWPRPQQVDLAMLRAHLHRVEWELDVLRAPQRNAECLLRSRRHFTAKFARPSVYPRCLDSTECRSTLLGAGFM
jgi:hypothetical protein